MFEFCRCCESLCDNSSAMHKCYSLFKNIQTYTNCQEFIDFDVIQALFECAHVKIYEDDGLSSLICSSCLAKLEVCVKFKQQIIKSELNQRKFLNDPFPLIIYKPTLIEDENLEREVLQNRRQKKRKRKVIDLTGEDESEVDIIEESVKIAEQLNIKITDVRSVNDQIEEAIPNDFVEGNCAMVNSDSTNSNTDLFLFIDECQENPSNQQENLIEIIPLGVEESGDQNIKNKVPDEYIFLAPSPTTVCIESTEDNCENSRKKANLSLQSSFCCDVCLKQFDSLDGLSAHKTHCVKKKNMEPTFYECGTCFKGFRCSEEFRFHRSKECSGVITNSGFVCALCPRLGTVFDNVDAVYAHIKFHHQPCADFTPYVREIKQEH